MKLSVLASLLMAISGVPAEESNTKAADALFQSGKFTEADVAYRDASRQDPKNARTVLRLGELALFSNRLGEAESRLQEVLVREPDNKRAKKLLAEAFYRRDDFDHAAKLLGELKQDVRAAQLASFHTQQAYAHEAPPGGSATLPFVVTDPLPIVRARVNGGDLVDFVIDTGGPETQIDRELAHQLKIQEFGSTSGMFAGGRRAAVSHGRVDSLQLAGLTIRNVPVGIMDFSGLGRVIFGGRKIGGVIGTVLFYHFLTTLDYAGHQLVLRERNAANSRDDAGSKVVPFWMAGDHFMVAWGNVNDASPVLLFVDTGLAGGGFTAGKSLIEEAHITLDEKHAGQALGGGGMVRMVPFRVKDLSLGEVQAHNVRGVFDGVLPMEHSFGFRIGGIISHEFFKPYALTFDFDRMRLLIHGGP